MNKMKSNDKLSLIIYKYFALGCSSLLVPVWLGEEKPVPRGFQKNRQKVPMRRGSAQSQRPPVDPIR